jgi:hypothetical protein
MAGVEVVHTEVTVANFTHRFAGTGDRVVRFRPLDAWAAAFDQYDLGRGSFWVDAKFGTVHDSVALQLAALTMGESIYDAGANTHALLPADLRTDIGFAFHPDQGLVPVDLTGAAEAFLGALAVKHHQSRGLSPLRSPLGPAVGSHAPPGNGQEPRRGAVQTGPAGAPTAGSTAPGAGSAPAPAVGSGQGADPDPFAGLPDETGHPQIDRAAKRAWLLERLTVLAAIDGGLEAVAARWPVAADGRRILTFKETTEHTAGELEAIQVAVAGAEAAVRAPFPERDDPTDPALAVVANDDPRVLALLRRGEVLPPDLGARARAAIRAEGVPKLSTGRVTEAHLPVIDRLLAAAEADAAQRAARVAAALGVAAEKGVSAAVLWGALGVTEGEEPTGAQLTGLDELVDAIALGVIVERAGALVVDRPADVLAAYGDDRRRLRTAGVAAARARGLVVPLDVDAVLSDPLLAAALLAV